MTNLIIFQHPTSARYHQLQFCEYSANQFWVFFSDILSEWESLPLSQKTTFCMKSEQKWLFVVQVPSSLLHYADVIFFGWFEKGCWGQTWPGYPFATFDWCTCASMVPNMHHDLVMEGVVPSFAMARHVEERSPVVGLGTSTRAPAQAQLVWNRKIFREAVDT